MRVGCDGPWCCYMQDDSQRRSVIEFHGCDSLLCIELFEYLCMSVSSSSVVDGVDNGVEVGVLIWR